MKVVINKRFGGFGLSDAAFRRLIDLGVQVRKHTDDEDPQGEVILEYVKGQDAMIDSLIRLMGTPFTASWLDRKRNDPRLIQVVESLGDAANGKHAKLKIVEIPDDVEWEIDEYDGMETIREVSRSWG